MNERRKEKKDQDKVYLYVSQKKKLVVYKT